MHVRALRPEQSLHAAVFPRQRRGSGPDVQFLHRPRLQDQLQRVLLRLLWLRGQQWEALGEEPVRRHRGGLASPEEQVSAVQCSWQCHHLPKTKGPLKGLPLPTSPAVSMMYCITTTVCCNA